MKKFIKLLLLFTFVIALDASDAAKEMIQKASIEVEVKISSIDSEEETKDFKLDLFVLDRNCYAVASLKDALYPTVNLPNETFQKAPFKPPRL